MKHIKSLRLLFILTIFILSACVNRAFIPLYPENHAPTQAANLITPIQIDLIYHNGQQKSFVPPYRPLVNYQLRPGKHLLGFRYQDVHADENEEQEIITSKTVLLEFMAVAGKTYRLDYQKPVDFVAAKQLEDEFQVILMVDKKIIASSTLAPERIEDSSFFSNSTFAEKTESSTQLPKKYNTTERLKYWWTQATQEERMRFIEWTE